VDRLRVVLCCGQKLVTQRCGEAQLSFLSHAEKEEWPDSNAADVQAWQNQGYVVQSLDDASATDLLQATGGHPGLIRWCLNRWETEGGNPAWHEWAYVCSELWETWHRLKSHDVQPIREALGRDVFGPALTWPLNPTIRELYWDDLLTARQGRLTWRAEVIRQVGREVLG